MTKSKKIEKGSDSASEKKIHLFDKEILRLPEELKKKLLSKKETIQKFTSIINKKVNDKSMGFYVVPEFEIKNGIPTPNFDKLSLNFLFDDFENPIASFEPKILFGSDFDKMLTEEKSKDEYGQEIFNYKLKVDDSISFSGVSISILRENCFDTIYDDLKKLGSCFIFEDSRGFIGALKTIDIHRNMLLQKFEKYVVVYAGAGSWLRGEKSNDFDVFVVVDDTDVKRMPRMQVKEQLTRIIWQMSHEVAALTGVQIHIQVYLLTDFWDALKDAHPVMFTFLRDGVPFYDRGLYNSWKELLKLGKIRPTPEAIDMHMNVGTQLIDRAKKVFADIVVNDIYNAVLSPSQAILMLKGYNPTTPKETVKMFKEVLLAKEKSISKKDVEILENTVRMFKKLEHDKETVVEGKDVDMMIKDAENFLKDIKKMFEEITDEKTKDSIISSYNELLNQIRTLPGFSEVLEKDIFVKFEKDYLSSGKLPTFVKSSLKSVLKAKGDYEKGKITVTEVNKVLKEARNIMSEIKSYRDSSIMSEISKRKLVLSFGEGKNAELINYGGKIYLLDLGNLKSYEFVSGKFKVSDIDQSSLDDSSKYSKLNVSEDLISAAKKTLDVKEIYF